MKQITVSLPFVYTIGDKGPHGATIHGEKEALDATMYLIEQGDLYPSKDSFKVEIGPTSPMDTLVKAFNELELMGKILQGQQRVSVVLGNEDEMDSLSIALRIVKISFPSLDWDFFERAGICLIKW